MRAAHSTRIVDEGEGVRRLALRGDWGLTVNAWLIRGTDSVALVDSGYQHTAGQLVDALAECGLSPRDVDAILYTHTHEDHVGGGLALEWSATHVYAEQASPAFEDYAAVYGARTPWDVWLDEVLGEGAEADAVRETRGTFASEPLTQRRFEGDHLAVAEGASVELGGRTLTCVAAPGHDPWHVVWTGEGAVYSGDVLLRIPTPILCGIGDALGAYRGTVESLEAQLDGCALRPGHGEREADAVRAARRAQRHLKALYRAACAALAEGPATPLRLARRWVGESLPDAAVYPLIGNAWAQLDELVRLGVAERDGAAFVMRGALPDFSELPRT